MADVTRWPQLLAWLDARCPELCQRFIGATPEQLQALFAISPRPVPQAVIDIVSSVGRDDGGYLPLGRQFTLMVEAQLDDMDEALVADRFLRFGLAIDRAEIGEPDLYVDLASNDGYDAPILQVCEPWDGRTPYALSHSVMSKAIQHAYKTIELQPRAELASLAQGIPVAALTDYIDAFGHLAARSGLDEPLQCRPQLRCGLLDGAALMFDALGPGVPLGVNPATEVPPSHLTVWVWIGADDQQTLARLSELLADHMPPLTWVRRRTDS